MGGNPADPTAGMPPEVVAMSEALESEISLRDRVESLRLPSEVGDPRRANRSAWLPWALCLLLGFGTLSLAIRVYSGKTAAGIPSTDTLNATADASPGTTTPAKNAVTSASRLSETPPVAPGALVLESKGYIIPAHLIQVSPIEVGGRVVELFVEEGKHFKKGHTLAVLDRTGYESEVLEATGFMKAAEARAAELTDKEQLRDIQKATADLREAESKVRQARLDYERNLNLPDAAQAKAEKEKSEMEFRAAEQRALSLRTTLESIVDRLKAKQAAALADVAAARARLDKAKWRLDNCTIRAPIDGTILTKKAELGNLVNPLAFGATSGSVCEMADLADLEVELDITERDIAKVKKGMPCRVRAEAFPDRVYDGIVDRLMPTANRAKGAVPVRVKISVPKGEEGVYLKPEMGAVVAFLQPQGEKK
jgi:multidrug resistance efflux pump